MSQQVVVQAQHKTMAGQKIATGHPQGMPLHGSILQRAAVIPAITPVHSGILQRCSGGVECEECRQKRLEREGMLQRAAVSAALVNDVPPIVHEVLSSPGQPLGAGTRAFMEPRFGYDFSHVRVHTDARAAESSRAVNALAYTVGRDVVFSAGQYVPETVEGKRLIAHELTHTVQQSAGMQRVVDRREISDPGDAAEQEAEASANAILQGRSFIPMLGEAMHLARQAPPQTPTTAAPAAPAAPTAQGRYWSVVRRDLQSGLTARGINGSEPFWNDFHKTLGFLGLIAKLENYSTWPLISKITNTWFGATVFGMGFTPTNGARLLAHLQSSKDVDNDIFPTTMHPGATWSFRDKYAIYSLHITGNSEYQAHIDNFNPMSVPPIGAVLHGLVDLIPSALGL